MCADPEDQKLGQLLDPGHQGSESEGPMGSDTANIDVKCGAGGRTCAHIWQILMQNEVLEGAHLLRHGRYRCRRRCWRAHMCSDTANMVPRKLLKGAYVHRHCK